MAEENVSQSPRLYPSLAQPNNTNNNDLNKAGNYPSPLDNQQRGSPSGERKDYKYFWKRVLKDLTNKNLIPVKILFFFKYATLFVLYPFLTLHMASLGLDEWEIGVNQACVPIVAILGPPISGVIADKIGNFKLVLAFITLVNAAVALLLLFVPVARETVTLPEHITFEISCDPSTQHFILNSIDPYICQVNASEWTSLPKTNLVQCGQLCRTPPTEDHLNQTNKLLSSKEIFPIFPLTVNSKISIGLKNQTYYFSTGFGAHPQFSCVTENGGDLERCGLSNSYDVDTSTNANDGNTETPRHTEQYSIMTLSKLFLMSSTERTLVSNLSSDLMHPQFSIEGPIIFNGDMHNNPRCVQPSEKPIIDDDINCETKCYLQMQRNVICGNDKEKRVYNVGLTFGIYTLFRILWGFASATSFIMFEGAVLAILKQYGGDYGLQRVSATFAAIIAAPISGMLLQKYDFKPVFFLYAALQAFSAVLTLKIDLTFKKPAHNVLRHLKEVLSQIEILIFFLAMLCSGTAWGYLESFLFLYLQKLGGSQTLMGLTISVGGLFGLPFLIFSRPIIKKIGHVNILCIGLLFYGIRYFEDKNLFRFNVLIMCLYAYVTLSGYSFIQNPWMCLPFEALESITASLAITAAATYAVALSSLQTIATVQGIMGALYFGIGRGAGSFVGGILIKRLGHRETLQIFGIASFVACLLYTIVNISYLRRHSKAGTGIDINNMNGTVISNGSAKLKPEEQFQMKPGNHDSELGYGKVNPGFEDGDTEDGTKFTDIPLDEDVHSSNLQNNNKPLA